MTDVADRKQRARGLATFLAVDVAIVGASLAGCAAARLFAREGLSVALLEKHSDPAAYKRLCGHFIQASATPVIERLGLAEAIEREGGVRNGADVWTEWGWIEPRPEPGAGHRFGYSIRRSRLDPLIRGLAAGTDGVTFLPGTAAESLLASGGTVTGVVGRDRGGAAVRVEAGLVVGADGRGSTVAKLAAVPQRRKPNNRFCWMAYYDGIEPPPGRRTHFWALGDDVVIASPNDAGITLVAAFPHKRRLPEFRTDREHAFEDLVSTGPSAPPLDRATRVSKLIGYTDYPIGRRPPTPRDGLALIGDAALTMDPVFAIGCGWALQSATWLVDSTTPALQGAEPLRRGLRRYSRVYRRRLGGHARVLTEAARGNPAPLPVRTMLAAATRDPATARRFDDYATRSTPVRRFLSPAALTRAAWVNARHQRKHNNQEDDR